MLSWRSTAGLRVAGIAAEEQRKGCGVLPPCSGESVEQQSCGEEAMLHPREAASGQHPACSLWSEELGSKVTASSGQLVSDGLRGLRRACV